MRVDYSCNIQYKQNPMSDWEPWMYMPPSEKTLEILKRETKKSIVQAKESGTFAVKQVGSVFFGHPVYAFKFNNNAEVYLDK